MASKNNNSSSWGVGFTWMLFLLFLGLKLTWYIAWSWWWVTAPLWAPLAIVLIVLLIAFIVSR